MSLTPLVVQEIVALDEPISDDEMADIKTELVPGAAIARTEQNSNILKIVDVKSAIFFGMFIILDFFGF